MSEQYDDYLCDPRAKPHPEIQALAISALEQTGAELAVDGGATATSGFKH